MAQVLGAYRDARLARTITRFSISSWRLILSAYGAGERPFQHSPCSRLWLSLT